MNNELFQTFQRAADPDLLEEALTITPQRRNWIPVAAVAVAACLCLTVAGILRQPHGPGNAQIANPVQTVTAADLQALGYSMLLPAEAKDVSYSTIDSGTANAVPMAQATFTVGENTYTYRSLKTETAEDISGIYSDWAEDLHWTAASLDLQYRTTTEEESCVSWYDAGSQTQWSLSGGSGHDVLHTAAEIMDTLGYPIDVAPEGASDVAYNVFAMDGLTVAETTFTLDGVRWVYRTAATGDVSEEFADISGMEDFASSAAGSVQYCPARLSWDAGGSGKIVWFDVVPGLLYSIGTDTEASEDALTSMANQLFTPAQSNVG